MTKLQFIFTKGASRLWVRPTLLSLAAILWVVLAYFASEFLPRSWRVDISKETLVNLFTILASTMLTVATFSVSAFSSVSTSGTPRATRIVMSDSAVQSTLAAFLAAFIYAVVAITVLSALNFQPSGRFLLFVGFVFLIGWVLISFLAWVDRISRLGKLGDTIDRVAAAARKAMGNPDNAGVLGARPQSASTRPDRGKTLHFDRFGYIQYIDLKTLQRPNANFTTPIRPAEQNSYYDLVAGEYKPMPERPGVLVLKSIKERTGVIKSNPGASLIDLGDGVACLEFHSKMNSIGGDTVQMMNFALDEVEKNFKGLVVGNQGGNFSAGANIKTLQRMLGHASAALTPSPRSSTSRAARTSRTTSRARRVRRCCCPTAWWR